jgi:hypothetical protein
MLPVSAGTDPYASLLFWETRLKPYTVLAVKCA